MVTTVNSETAALKPGLAPPRLPGITIFHCFNAISSTAFLNGREAGYSEIKMPCSSLIREVHLLRAFESGADAVIVFACPEGKCLYVEGNIRAAKRVNRIKKLLDEIGIDGRRLSIHFIPAQNAAAVEEIVRSTIAGLAELGPNPAAGK